LTPADFFSIQAISQRPNKHELVVTKLVSRGPRSMPGPGTHLSGCGRNPRLGNTKSAEPRGGGTLWVPRGRFSFPFDERRLLVLPTPGRLRKDVRGA
jgi:hypothetical protein